MARLPTVMDLGAAPRVAGSRPIGSLDLSGLSRGVSSVGSAMEQEKEADVALGKGVAKLGEGMTDFELDKGRWEYAKAHSEQVTGKIKLYTEMRDDPDYSTMGERYSKKIAEVNATAANQISSPFMRERFMTDTKSDIAQFESNVTEHAKKLESHASIGWVLDKGDKFIEQAANAPDEATRRQVIDSHNQLIDGLQARQFIMPEQARQMKKQWAHRYATADVLSTIERDPAEAVRRLESKDEKSIYQMVPPEERANLLTRARSANVGEQYAVKRLVEDDLQSVLSTGEGVKDLTSARVMSAYGPKGASAVAEWQTGRKSAMAIWSGTHDMNDLTEQGLTERVDQYKPKPGAAGFDQQNTIYDAVQKHAQAVLKARYEDPAAAVAGNADVAAAKGGYSSLDPSTFRPVAQARMDAQAKLGIPEDIRSPITKDEALKLTTPLARMLPGQERDTLTDIAKTFQQMFGEDADQAFEYALRVRKINNQTAETAARVMKKLGLGQPVETGEARAADQQQEVKAADEAVTTTSQPGAPRMPGASTSSTGLPMVGQPAPAQQTKPAAQPAQQGSPAAKPSSKEQSRLPPAEDIMALRKNPKLAPRYEAKYGVGSAKRILEQYPVGVGQ